MSIATLVSTYIDSFANYLIDNFGMVFSGVSVTVAAVTNSVAYCLSIIPPWALISIVSVLAFWKGGIGLGLLATVGLGIIEVLDLWAPSMVTLSLVLSSLLFSLFIGIPVGALISESERLRKWSEPILDFMQTMPSFVLLVPAVLFFGVGNVPAVIATVFFAMPLPIRFAAHGLATVSKEAVEAGNSLGATRMQLLLFIKLPLAFRVIMVGVNQCTMMCLAMVIVASMIGAGGLGDEIIRAISRLQIGKGIQAGFAVVIIAILMDRITKRISNVL